MSAADDFGADAPDQAEATPEQLAQLAADLAEPAAAGSHAQLGPHIEDCLIELDALIESWAELLPDTSPIEPPPWFQVLYPKWLAVLRAYNAETGSAVGRWAHLQEQPR